MAGSRGKDLKARRMKVDCVAASVNDSKISSKRQLALTCFTAVASKVNNGKRITCKSTRKIPFTRILARYARVNCFRKYVDIGPIAH